MDIKINPRDVDLFDSIAKEIFTKLILSRNPSNYGLMDTMYTDSSGEYIAGDITNCCEIAMKSAEYFLSQRRKYGIRRLSEKKIEQSYNQSEDNENG